MKISRILVIFLVLIFLFCFSSPSYAAQKQLTVESAHFIFFFESDSQTEKDIEKIVDFYEKVIDDLEERFQVKTPTKIEIYLFDHPPSALTEKNKICDFYSSENPAFRLRCHELAHAFFHLNFGEPMTCNFAYPNSISEMFGTPLYLNFLDESMAVAIDFYYAKKPPVHILASALFRLGVSLYPENILTVDPNLTSYDSLIGQSSFFLFLLERFPPDCFKSLWQEKGDYLKEAKENLEAGFSKIYGKSFGQIQKEWRDFLLQQEVPNSWKETIRRQRELAQIMDKMTIDFNSQLGTIKLDRNEMPSLREAISACACPPSVPVALERVPYGVLQDPMSNFSDFDEAYKNLSEIAAVAEEALQLCYKAQVHLAKKDWTSAYEAFSLLRLALNTLGNTSYLPWVDKNLEELKGKVPPELVRSLEGKVFPWWGWALIGCGAAGVLGLGGWLFVFKRRAHQKGKGQQP